MNKLIIGLLVVFLLLVSFPLVLAHGENEVDYNGHHEGMMSGFYGTGGMWFFGWLFMLLIIVALVLFIVWLLKQLTKENRRKR